MTSDDLLNLKRRLYDQAGDDGSIALCAMVAEVLGRELPANYGPKYEWTDGDGVVIYLDRWGGYMQVSAGGVLKCSTHYCHQLFVPGDWMEVVKDAAVHAKHVKEVKEHRTEEAKKRALLNELGLS